MKHVLFMSIYRHKLSSINIFNVILTLIFVLSISNILADIIRVPEDCASISAAVEFLQNDETPEFSNEIIVSPREEPYEDYVILDGFDRDLIISSEYDPQFGYAVIKALPPIEQEGYMEGRPVFYIINCNPGHWPEDNRIILRNLNITGGTGHPMDNGTTLQNNINNSGGGVCIVDHGRDMSVNIENCRIYGNKAFHGGGIFSYRTNLKISDTEIYNNSIYIYGREYPQGFHEQLDGPKGGGIFVNGGTTNILETNIYDNKSYIEPDDELYQYPNNWNLFTGGNYSALYYRNFCGETSIKLDKCQIYGNITKVDNEILQMIGWNIVANAFFQKPDSDPGNPVDPDLVEILNCTVTKNEIDTNNNGGVYNTAIGIGRYFATHSHDDIIHIGTDTTTHIYGCIVFNNTYGEPGHQIILPRQIYGGDTNEEGVWVAPPVKIDYCDVNYATNALYYNAKCCIASDPRFSDAINNVFKLRWDRDAMSPCILSCENSNLNLPEHVLDMGALQIEEPWHYYSRHIIPAVGIMRPEVQWISIPIIDRISNGGVTAKRVFKDILNPHVIDAIEWTTVENGLNAGHIINYWNGEWQNLDAKITSTQGFKIYINRENREDVKLESKGTIMPSNSSLNFCGADPAWQIENWVGFFLPVENMSIWDALGDFEQHLYRIDAQTWSLSRINQNDPHSPWNIQFHLYPISYGDMVILYGYEGAPTQFRWCDGNFRQPVSSNTAPVAGIQISNFPNPFNPTTTISYNLPKEMPCTLNIYNMKGQKVKTLAKGIQTPGNHKSVWNGTDDAGKVVSSGLYLYKLTTPGKVITNRMIMLK